MLLGTGALGLAGVLAACGTDDGAPSGSTSGSAQAAATGDHELLNELLAQAPQCPTTSEETEGPYWFDVDRIRADIREDREGVPLALALRVVDLDNCRVDGDPAPVSDAVVEIWHCDAEGNYSGFEANSASSGGPGGGPPGGAPPAGERPSGQPPAGGPGGPGPGGDGGGTLSDGSYSSGDRESTTSDEKTYLRGAQSTDSSGIARFTSIYPGWYSGRTVHIHLRVHLNKTTARTSQLYFDDDLNDSVFAARPYSGHPDRDTRNDTDGIYDATGLLKAEQDGGTVYAAVNLGITRT
ncbi:intradiol ring-cleavage dioxygenase [Gordonia caeni]